MHFSMSLKTSIAFAAILAATPALALDGQAVLDRLAAQLELQGVTLKAEGVETDGSNVILKTVSIGADGANAPLTADEVLLENVIEGGNGGYIIGRTAIPAGSIESDGIGLVHQGAVLEGYVVAGADETDPLLKGSIYRRFSVGPMAVGPAGKQAFSMSGMVSEISPYEPGATLTTTMKVSDVVMDFSAVDDPKVSQTMSALGYSTVKGEITGEGSWDTTTGALVIDSIKLAADDAADISVGLNLGGYTPQIVAAMQEMTKTMKGNDQAMGMAMLGLMQQLDISRITVRIDDKSLTGRLLDFFGSQQGMNRESTVAMAKGMLPLGLAQLQAPEFAAKASAAIGSYLDDPKSLTIAAEPGAPVPVAQLIAAGASSPQQLINTLNVQVRAND